MFSLKEYMPNPIVEWIGAGLPNLIENLQSGKGLGKPQECATDYDFPMWAYVHDRYEVVVDFLHRAVDVDAQPDLPVEPGEYRIERKRLEDGVTAFRASMAAHLLGRHRDRDRSLKWALHQFKGATKLSKSNSRLWGRLLLYRSYAMLASGQAVAVSDLNATAPYAMQSEGSYELPLIPVLTKISHAHGDKRPCPETRWALERFIRSARPDGRLGAGFHVLFLQDRWPQLFERTLPPLFGHRVG